VTRHTIVMRNHRRGDFSDEVVGLDTNRFSRITESVTIELESDQRHAASQISSIPWPTHTNGADGRTSGGSDMDMLFRRHRCEFEEEGRSRRQVQANISDVFICFLMAISLHTTTMALHNMPRSGSIPTLWHVLHDFGNPIATPTMIYHPKFTMVPQDLFIVVI
jgi:hypothetical protein